MSREQQGNRESALWITLDEAVRRSGVSKRSILDWVAGGLIKKEKKKGLVYLWVSDLVRQTPLVEEMPVESGGQLLLSPESEVLTANVMPPALQNFSGKIQESLELQNKILAELAQVRTAVERPLDKGGLDDKTVRELSLLGSVFRSIHQQNEKVQQNLAQQGGLLEQISSGLKRGRELEEQLIRAEKKSTRLGVAGFSMLAALALAFIAVCIWMIDKDEQRNGKLAQLQGQIGEKERLGAEAVLKLKDEHAAELKRREEEKSRDLQALREKQAAELARQQAMVESLSGTFSKQNDQLLAQLREREAELRRAMAAAVVKASTDAGAVAGGK